MNEPTNTPARGVDLSIDIDASLGEVWHALTTGEGIARWFTRAKSSRL